MRHDAYRYLHEWKQPNNQPEYSSQPQSAQVDPSDNQADVDKQSDSDFAENPEIFDGNTANCHEIRWKIRMRDVSRRCVCAVFFFFVSSSLKEENTAVRMKGRLYKIVFVRFFTRWHRSISKLPPKWSKMIMKIMVNALRAIFALCERIVMHLLSLNAQKHTHWFYVTVKTRQIIAIYTYLLHRSWSQTCR